MNGPFLVLEGLGDLSVALAHFLFGISLGSESGERMVRCK